MSQRREIEARLTLFNELTGILGAMRSFALTELRRVGKREDAQQLVMQSLSTALNDVAGFGALQTHESVVMAEDEIWLLFGSVRGFCGSFNEDVIRFWQTRNGDQSSLILLGERLHDLLPDREKLVRIAGADNGLNTSETIDRILAAVAKLRGAENRAFRLQACIRDEQGARHQQLWPLPVVQSNYANQPPLTHEPLADVAAQIAKHYLYHSLLALLLRSIKVENHMRLMQMETALRHLDRGTEEMLRQRNRLRQEEIVEEIELMVVSRH